MGKVRQLIQAYKNHISIPWRSGAASPQRVIFCIYNEDDELAIRAKIDEFRIVTKEAGHGWVLFDLTDTFAHWLAGHRYRESYFKNPNLIQTQMTKYLEYVKNRFKALLEGSKVDENTVVAIMGVASIYGFTHTRNLVDAFAPLVKGRLLVFFPGTYDKDTYRLLNASEGWNYLAIPLTANMGV